MPIASEALERIVGLYAVEDKYPRRQRFLDDRRIVIDSNVMARAIRPRAEPQNRLFAGWTSAVKQSSVKYGCVFRKFPDRVFGNSRTAISVIPGQGFR
jgi:hypothetical protein